MGREVVKKDLEKKLKLYTMKKLREKNRSKIQSIEARKPVKLY